MYIFEFTDECINVYNQKKQEMFSEFIPAKVIVNNKIYDYLKLVNIIENIVNKYKIINTLFRIKIKILIFEKLSPSEIYLFKNLFKYVSNVIVEIVNVNKVFNGSYLFVSGNKVYYNNSVVNKLKHQDYILIGKSNNFNLLKSKLEEKYKISILEYENSETYIFENV